MINPLLDAEQAQFLESARRFDAIGLIEIRTDDTSAKIKLTLLTKAHRQPGIGPVE